MSSSYSLLEGQADRQCQVLRGCASKNVLPAHSDIAILREVPPAGEVKTKIEMELNLAIS